MLRGERTTLRDVQHLSRWLLFQASKARGEGGKRFAETRVSGELELCPELFLAFWVLAWPERKLTSLWHEEQGD